MEQRWRGGQYYQNHHGVLKTAYSIPILLCAVLLSACSVEEETDVSIKSVFDAPFPGKPRNLLRILGN